MSKRHNLQRSIHEQKLIDEGRHKEFYIPVPLDGGKSWQLYVQLWAPADPPRALVIYLHGMHDSSGRFAENVYRFHEHGYAVGSFDHYGHGRSEGTHGYIPSTGVLSAAVEAAMAKFDAIDGYSKLPVFIYGESMGGLVAMNSILQDVLVSSRCTGLMLINPAIKVHDKFKPPEFVIRLFRLLAKLVPKLPAVPQKKENIHPDPEIQRQIFGHPGAYGGWMRIGTGTTLLDITDFLMGAQQTKFKGTVERAQPIPTLILLGMRDMTCDPQGTIDFFNQWQQANRAKVDYERFEDAHHVIATTDSSKNDFFQKLFQWIDQQMNNQMQ